jgi:hypothetical protein
MLAWLESREGWRPHVINWALGFVREGLQDRAITRDIDWGVELPDDVTLAGAEGKRIYVWFDAVIGYLSASREWAQRSGDPEAWRAWWEDPAAESYYFIGKDNVPFHAVFWPAQLMGSGTLNLPTDVPANQYVTFKGAKASKSRGVGRSLLDYLELYQPDALRYAVAAHLPEQADVDLTEEDMVRRINDELAAAWGNLVNRVFAMTAKSFDGVVPEARASSATSTVRCSRRSTRCSPTRCRARGRRAAPGAAPRAVGCAGGQRVPQRDWSRGARRRRTCAHGDDAQRRAAGDRRARRRVRAVHPVLVGHDPRLARAGRDARGGWLASPEVPVGDAAR